VKLEVNYAEMCYAAYYTVCEQTGGVVVLTVGFQGVLMAEDAIEMRRRTNVGEFVKGHLQFNASLRSDLLDAPTIAVVAAERRLFASDGDPR